MKILALCFIAMLAHYNVGATTLSPDLVAQKIVRENCQFELDDYLRDKVRVSADPEENSNVDLAVVQFDIDVTVAKKKVVATLLFQCEFGKSGAAPSLPPDKKIESENSGGRYFKHLAWLRKFSGRGWDGALSYVDYILGDGVKSPVGSFMLCRGPDYRACVSVEVIAKATLSKKDVKRILEIYDHLTLIQNL